MRRWTAAGTLRFECRRATPGASLAHLQQSTVIPPPQKKESASERHVRGRNHHRWQAERLGALIAGSTGRASGRLCSLPSVRASTQTPPLPPPPPPPPPTGFKSYAQRVTVGPFDKHFNAITGMNGTGKSNVLDAVCFVLGITNLAQVRASSLQELVYKGGQAGVTKATVSVTFNNEDKPGSPAGYEHLDRLVVSRSIAVGGRNKFLINGRAADATRVANLFASVGLNVNHPHFLIMQGRITKVLNMRPLEIMGMLEEAAGTRTYDAKRDAAIKTMDRKQVKVDEIDRVLQEDIRPALEKLRGERAAYLEWAEAEREIEGRRRSNIAWQWTRLTEEANGGDRAEEMRAEAEAARGRLHEAEAEVRAADEEAERVAANRAAREGAAGASARAALDAAKRAVVTETSAATSARKELEREEAGLTELDEAERALDPVALDAAAEAARATHEAACAATAAAERDARAALAELAGARAGDGRDGSGRSAAERLLAARGDQATAAAAAKVAEATARDAKKQLMAVQKNIKKHGTEAARMARELAAAEKRAKSARESLEAAAAPADGDALGSTAVAAHALAQADLRRFRALHDESQTRAQGVLFRFEFPGGNAPAGFTPSGVRGTLAELLTVPDRAHCLAIEVAAGRKLRDVVVDTDATARALLQHGRMRGRTTFLPLNRIRGSPVPEDLLARAREQSGGRARPALDLVRHPKDIGPAAAYALGSVLICDDAATARALAFSPDVGVRCVTLEGDDFNPTGVLSGGARGGGAHILLALADMAEARAGMADATSRLAALEGASAAAERAAAARGDLEEAVTTADDALKLLRERHAASEASALAAQAEELEEKVRAAEAARAEALAILERSKEEASRLDHDIKNWSKVQKQRIAEGEARLADREEALAASKEAEVEAEAARSRAEAEREASAGERAALLGRREAAAVAVEAARAAVVSREATAERLRAEAAAAAETVEALEAELKRADADLRRLMTLRAHASKRAEREVAVADDADRALAALLKTVERSRAAANELEREHRWITSERHLFNQPGGPFDWSQRDPAAEARALEAAEARHRRLSATVNRRVMAAFEKAEAEHRVLAARKHTVRTDRDKIEAVIRGLDDRKREALEATRAKVGRDFSSIFSTLLPGAQAELAPPDGAKSFLEDGLEVRVAFNGAWKAGLSELSGGQRSLLALSLILALLLFRPAPLYVLDEVDAALDLSHTQNIGRMIRQHFPHAQFIVVSLKEGMFNNANALFRTRFVDGVSAVTRTAGGAAVIADTGNGKSAGWRAAGRPALAHKN